MWMGWLDVCLLPLMEPAVFQSGLTSALALGLSESPDMEGAIHSSLLETASTTVRFTALYYGDQTSWARKLAGSRVKIEPSSLFFETSTPQERTRWAQSSLSPASSPDSCATDFPVVRRTF